MNNGRLQHYIKLTDAVRAYLKEMEMAFHPRKLAEFYARDKNLRAMIYALSNLNSLETNDFMTTKTPLKAELTELLDVAKRVQELATSLLTDTINAMPDDKPVHVGRWKPEVGEHYHYVASTLAIDRHCWRDDQTDRKLLRAGNVYRTREEAERAADRRLVHVELQDLADAAWAESGEVLDWGNDEHEKVRVEWNYGAHTLYFESAYRYQTPNTVYFPSEASYRAAVEKIGAERFEMYCKGV
jgi:hypothetical protein